MSTAMYLMTNAIHGVAIYVHNTMVSQMMEITTKSFPSNIIQSSIVSTVSIVKNL